MLHVCPGWVRNLPQARWFRHCALQLLGSGLGHPATHLRSLQSCAVLALAVGLPPLCAWGSRVESSSTIERCCCATWLAPFPLSGHASTTHPLAGVGGQFCYPGIHLQIVSSIHTAIWQICWPDLRCVQQYDMLTTFYGVPIGLGTCFCISQNYPFYWDMSL